MQKNAYKIIALTLLLMLLCGCKQSRSLGERAIVKMVYLDESGGQVQAGLGGVTCAPESDTGHPLLRGDTVPVYGTGSV